jgi:hypothetical protein
MTISEPRDPGHFIEPGSGSIDKLNELIRRCKCGVQVSINEHRNYYQTAEQWLKDLNENDITTPAADIQAEMIKQDTVVEIQFYPVTPVGFHLVIHHDLDAALDLALAAVKG